MRSISFKTAISKKSDFYDAYAEMGYAYADLGEMELAQEVVDFWKTNPPVLPTP
jgi:uncharacterized protein HemY